MSMRIIEHKKLKIRDLVEGYINDDSTGQVTAMNGRLNVRPAYQRQFVWDKGNEKGGRKQEALIDSILHGYPINVMYWVKTGKNQAGEDIYECLDGQQRIITICKFHEGDISDPNNITFGGLSDNSIFLEYNTFTVYVCEADTLEEKLAWFERINTGGEPLSKQEMRSAIACGDGTTLAKKYFVNTKDTSGANAYSFDIQSGRPGRDYISGQWDRQEVYEKVIAWYVSSKKDEDILAYMKNNRNDEWKATELFDYYKNVIKWVKRYFPTYHKDMQKVEWGFLYNKYKNNIAMSSKVLEQQVKYLREDVGNGDNEHLKSSIGIYEYVLAIANGVEEKEAAKLLQKRAFPEKAKIAQYERQRHVCPHCMKRFEDISMMVGDHIIPYNPIPKSGQINGQTTASNLQMLCHSCNLEKSNNPFDKEAEESRLQKLYEMSDEEISALQEGVRN